MEIKSKEVKSKTHSSIRGFHQLGDQELLLRFVGLRRDHVSHSFVEGVNLKRGEIGSDALKVSEDFVDEGLLLAGLLHHKVATTP